MTAPVLSPAQTATARSRLYALFGRLYAQGLTPSLRALVADLPDLAAHLPRPYSGDEAAAEHYRLLGREVPPHASLFLDPAGLLGGPVADRVQASYAQAGYAPASSAAATDALGEELGLLAFLAGAEADAWADGKPGVAARMARLQADFLADHLLPWLPPFVLALRAEASLFYTALADLTLALAAEQMEDESTANGSDSSPETQRRRNGEESRGEIRVSPRSSVASGAVNSEVNYDLLDDEKTGLREIAGLLTSAPLCGVYLSAGAVARLGRELGLPRGFGPRAQMLETLLRSAAQYERVPAAVAGLDRLWGQWATGYAALRDDYPHLSPALSPWLGRTAETRGLLQRIQGGLLTTSDL